MESDRSARQTRKAAKRTKRRKKQAQGIADAEAGVNPADGTEALPTSFWKFAAVVLIAIAWIIFVAVQDWGAAVNIIGLVFIGIPFGIVSWLKGRKVLGVIGFLIWPLAVISALRLARPFSWWFDRFYVPTSKERAEHPLSRAAGSSARRALTRQIGLLDNDDIRAVNEAYVLGNATLYLESEWELGRGFKDEPLPVHYQGLFQFFNVIDDDIADSADPKELGEYWEYVGYDPWAESDLWPPKNATFEQGQAESAEEPKAGVEAKGEGPDYFNDIVPKELDMNLQELMALPEDDQVWQAVMALRFEITADLERGVSLSEVKEQLRWGEIKDLPPSERFVRARQNWKPISPDSPFREENLPMQRIDAGDSESRPSGSE